MNETLTVFEAGVRDGDGNYRQFIQSNDRVRVVDYIEIMKESCFDSLDIVFLEKTFHLVSTTQHIINRSINDE